MNDLISKYDVLEICKEQIWNGADDYYPISANKIAKKVKELPTVDALVITRCKDCKYRPRRIEKNGGNWFDLEFPDNRCPCQGDDGRYNWMPDDNWYCGNAERKE